VGTPPSSVLPGMDKKPDSTQSTVMDEVQKAQAQILSKLDKLERQQKETVSSGTARNHKKETPQHRRKDSDDIERTVGSNEIPSKESSSNESKEQNNVPVDVLPQTHVVLDPNSAETVSNSISDATGPKSPQSSTSNTKGGKKGTGKTKASTQRFRSV